MTIEFDPSTYSVNEASMTVQVCARILDGSLQRDAVAILSTTDGTATGVLLALPRSFNDNLLSPLAPDDYTAVNVPLVFSESNTMECVDISIHTDALDEVNEMFSLNLDTDDSSVILDPQSAPVTIIDSDSMSVYYIYDVDFYHFPTFPVIGLDPATYTVSEGTPTVDLVVSVLDGTLDRPIFVTLTLQDGTAAGKDSNV